MNTLPKILAHLGRAVIGAILGVFTIGIAASLLFGPTMAVGLVSALLGVVAYHSFLFYKQRRGAR